MPSTFSQLSFAHLFNLLALSVREQIGDDKDLIVLCYLDYYHAIHYHKSQANCGSQYPTGCNRLTINRMDRIQGH